MSSFDSEEALRLALVSGLGLKLDETEPVSQGVLGHATYLLDRYWLHSHFRDHQQRTMVPHPAVRQKLSAFLAVLRTHRSAIADMANEQMRQDGNEAWVLLPWLSEQGVLVENTVVSELAKPGDRAYFGEPVPSLEGVGVLSLQFLVTGRVHVAREGHHLLELALDTFKAVHGWVLKHELRELAPHVDVDAMPELSAGATRVERRVANLIAHHLLWS